MIAYRYLLLASALVLGNGDCSENEIPPEISQEEGSEVSNDPGPSISETIAQIASDPGASFGGDR